MCYKGLMAKQIKAKRTQQVPEMLPETATAMPTRLMLRGNVYAARIHVPKDLWTIYGRQEVWKSLRTSDRRQAVFRLHQFCAQLEGEFERLRYGPPLKERLQKHFIEMMTAPLHDSSLTDEQKTEHIRQQAAKFAAYVTPEQMHARWVIVARPVAKTADEGLAALRKLVGTKSCTEITRDDVVAARDSWLAKSAPGTVKKRLGLCGAIYQAVLKDSKFGLKVNPVHGVRVRGARKPIKRRGHWTTEDAKQFLEAHPEGPLRDIFTLLWWTGARLGEIAGLREHDIKLTAAVPHLVIEPHGERRLKTEESARRVPLVHQEVLEAAQRVAAGSLKGATIDAWSKRLNRARRDLAIPHDIHTLRHGFKLAWRACGLPEDQGDAIQGHKNGTVSRTYGSSAGYPLRPLAASLSKLRFDGD